MNGRLIIIGSLLAIVLAAAAIFVLRMDGNSPGKSVQAGDASIFDGFSSQAGSKDTADRTANPAALAQARAMHKALPGNVFLPPLPDEADRIRLDKRNHLLNRLRKTHHKIGAGTASSDERAEYYAFRVKYNRDKIAMLKYVAVRGKTPGLGPKAMAPHITRMIEKLQGEIKSFEKKIPPR